MRAVVFDNEAVQALLDRRHAKHRAVLAHLQAIVVRRRAGTEATAAVPTAVRVEAGWDRTDARAAAINRFRIADAPLDTTTADLAAAVVGRAGVSVADAHVGVVARTALADDVVVLTSDPDDIARAAAPRRVTIVRV